MSWILILWIHQGPISNADSMTMTNIPGFTSHADCKQAGQAANELTSMTFEKLAYVCVSQKIPR